MNRGAVIGNAVSDVDTAIVDVTPVGDVSGHLFIDLDADEEALGSPFNFARQAKIYLPERMPDPRSGDGFEEAVADADPLPPSRRPGPRRFGHNAEADLRQVTLEPAIQPDAVIIVGNRKLANCICGFNAAPRIMSNPA